MLFKVDYYRDKNGYSDVEEFIEKLNVSPDSNKQDRILRSKIDAYILRIKAQGTRAGFPITRQIKGHDDLWELRPLNNRIFYFCHRGGKIILLHHFVKKSNKTPKNELEIAVNRMKDYKERN
jgi:phage-related protein